MSQKKTLIKNWKDLPWFDFLKVMKDEPIVVKGAFGFGLKFGKSKILPSISPNKTWVGTIAGLISSLLIMISLYQFNFFKGLLSIYDILIVGLISGIFGQFGDFAESLLKREAKIKDTSNFLMGHGGILDRFDSLTFAAPITLYYCNYFIQVGK